MSSDLDVIKQFITSGKHLVTFVAHTRRLFTASATSNSSWLWLKYKDNIVFTVITGSNRKYKYATFKLLLWQNTLLQGYTSWRYNDIFCFSTHVIQIIIIIVINSLEFQRKFVTKHLQWLTIKMANWAAQCLSNNKRLINNRISTSGLYTV